MAKKKSKRSLPVPERHDRKPDDWEEQFQAFCDFCARRVDLALGIDPGAKGAIVAVSSDFAAVGILDTPRVDYNAKNRTKAGNISHRTRVDYERWHKLLSAISEARVCEAAATTFVYEDMLGYSPGMTRGATMSLLGQQHGFTEALLFERRDILQLIHVTPRVWKRHFELQQKKADKKAVLAATSKLVNDLTSNRLAQQFSSREEHSGRCDAFLLAAWHWQSLQPKPVKKAARTRVKRAT